MEKTTEPATNSGRNPWHVSWQPINAISSSAPVLHREADLIPSLSSLHGCVLDLEAVYGLLEVCGVSLEADKVADI